jgi:hypothetical protein
MLLLLFLCTSFTAAGLVQAVSKLLQVATRDAANAAADPESRLQWLQSCLGANTHQAFCAAGALLAVLDKVTLVSFVVMQITAHSELQMVM